MNRRDQNHKHTALMLLACAFGFVYLMAWQFQGDEMIQHWDGIENPMPTVLNTSDLTKPMIDPATLTGNSTTGVQAPGSSAINGSMTSFTSLNALPQSFIRLGLASTQGIMIDQQRIIVTSNTNRISWSGDRKTFVGDELGGLGIVADSLTFYNDPSRVNILVVVEIVRNQQSWLMQIPYAIYRDDKSSINSLIAQLTQ